MLVVTTIRSLNKYLLLKRKQLKYLKVCDLNQHNVEDIQKTETEARTESWRDHRRGQTPLCLGESRETEARGAELISPSQGVGDKVQIRCGLQITLETLIANARGFKAADPPIRLGMKGSPP